MTQPDLAWLEGLVENIGPLPIDPIWMYEAIRHAQRNMDLDVAEGFCEPDRYAGRPIGELINALPALLARVRELEVENAAGGRNLYRMQTDNAALVLALRSWKCGSCGGSGWYKNKFMRGDEHVEEDVPCKVCAGEGLSPIARATLNRSETDAG